MKINCYNKNLSKYFEYDSDIEFETKYTADNGQSTIIPMSSKWKTIGILASGGLDSTLLIYLTAKTIIDNNLDIKILPISLELETKVKNLSSARAILAEIKKTLNADDVILEGKEVFMSAEFSSVEGYHSGNKTKFFNDTVVNLYNAGEFQQEFNGNTLNPPAHIRNNFHNNQYREYNRDEPPTIYNGIWSASPHAMIDKCGIINLYIKHGILDTISPLTLSCDQDIDNAIRAELDIPCGECWWCDERKWGFESNNAIDTAPKQPRLW